MTYETILVETKGRVGIITFNRPDRRNALGETMTEEMRSQIEVWNSDKAISTIILTGAGQAFCSGADIGGFKQEIDDSEEGKRAAERRRRQEPWPLFCRRSKPIICAINGPAIGVGLTLTLPCDVRIASDRALLSMRFVRVGILPELASTHILPHIVGLGQAMELMLSGKNVSGEEAARIGLVNRVVPHDKLMEEALAAAGDIAFNPTESLLAIKNLTWQNLDESDIMTIHERERQEFTAAQARPAFKEAVNAFLEKRQPDFHKA
ncbi:enoyl-CoA hydratase/isomerase family protein [Chloroflexota bacterium]